MTSERQQTLATPNYERPCTVCGQVPTVDLCDVIMHYRTVERIRAANTVHTELCGPCTWGEAETIDPENW